MIDKAKAKAFFAALEDNESMMGEGAALGVTLEQFGYDNWEMDVLADMAEALEQDEPKAPEKKKRR